MKKYMLIQNNGEIEINSFELIGGSTKRNEKGKIGFFGSGLKYSIAYMMRNGIDFKVFSGENEIIFSTIKAKLKDQEFDRICINGQPTSYTLTMGPTWTEDWFVLREIYCNAMDEEGCQLVRETELINPAEGKTRIYVELTESLKIVVDSWDSYFSEDRTPLFVAKNAYTCYLGTEDDHSAKHTASRVMQDVKVYNKTEGILFRRGIRVNTNNNYLYDYEAHYININEDRTAKNPGAMDYAITSIAAHFDNESWLKTVLRSFKEISGEYAMLSAATSGFGSGFRPSNRWCEFSKKHLLVINEISGRYTEEVMASDKEVFYIPSVFAKKLKEYLGDEIRILGVGNSSTGVLDTKVELSSKGDYLLKDVLNSLKEMKYEIHFPIKIVKFEADNILGQADFQQDAILLSTGVFDMGKRMLASVLMEENEHLISRKADRTREFQNHIFSKWLATMEETHGLFL